MEYKIALIIFAAILNAGILVRSSKHCLRTDLKSVDGLREGCGQTPGYSDWPTTGDIFHGSTSRRQSRAWHRSINGYDAKYRQFPSLVEVSAGRMRCGGTIIHNNIIITAAHCVRFIKTDSGVSVEAGNANDRDRVPEIQERISAKICRDPKFVLHHPKPTAESKVITAEYDIALIYLEEPFNYSDYVQPACLAMEKRPLASTQCLSVGFGNGARNPQRVQVLPVKRDCIKDEKYADQLTEIENSPDRSCYQTTMPERRGHTCNGDSGGPTYCMEKHDGIVKQWVVAATSYGLEEKCLNDTSPPYFNGNINMEFYKMRDRITALLEHCTIP